MYTNTMYINLHRNQFSNDTLKTKVLVTFFYPLSFKLIWGLVWCWIFLPLAEYISMKHNTGEHTSVIFTTPVCPMNISALFLPLKIFFILKFSFFLGKKKEYQTHRIIYYRVRYICFQLLVECGNVNTDIPLSVQRALSCMWGPQPEIHCIIMNWKTKIYIHGRRCFCLGLKDL